MSFVSLGLCSSRLQGHLYHRFMTVVESLKKVYSTVWAPETLYAIAKHVRALGPKTRSPRKLAYAPTLNSQTLYS